MEHFVFYSKLILALGKAAFCTNQNIHGALLHVTNRFVCRSSYGVKIFLVVIYNNVEVKIAVGVRGTVGKRAEQINTNRIKLLNEPLVYDFNFIHKCPAPFAYNTIASCKTIINDEQESGNL